MHILAALAGRGRDREVLRIGAAVGADQLLVEDEHVAARARRDRDQLLQLVDRDAVEDRRPSPAG